MAKTYYELFIKPSANSELFSDLIFSLGYDAIEERDGFLILRSDEKTDELEFGLYEFAKKLSQTLGKKIQISIKKEIKNSIDWVKNYQNSVNPVEIDKFYIRADWHKDNPQKTNIIINPALAFGSGHHESTYGCVKMLEKYLKSTDKMLDVGSGSGILSIIGSNLGAIVDFCDTDEIAVKSSVENFEKNKISPNKYWIGSANKTDKKYDLVIANIIADIIFIISNDLKDRVKDEGFLILSGILEKDKERIKKHFLEFKFKETYKKNEWCSIVFKKG